MNYFILLVKGKNLNRTYGKVVKAINKETGAYVAIKKFKDSEENPSIKKTALREIRILKMLKHTNIVHLIEVLYQLKKIYLVFEYVEYTVLEEIKRNPLGIDKINTKKIIYQLLLSVNYCHCLHIVHRDLKPENLLLSSTGVLKLCDFGFARLLKTSQQLTEYVSTRWYRAPELLVGGKNYGFPVDIWSIGCLLGELLTGKPLFPGMNDADTLAKIVKLCGNIPQALEEEFKSNGFLAGLEVLINQTGTKNKFKEVRK